VRGRDYFQDHKKYPSEPAVFRTIGVQAYAEANGGLQPIFHACQRVPSLRQHIESRQDRTFFVFVFVLPGVPRRSCVFAFERSVPSGVDPSFDRLFAQFMSGLEDSARQSMLKYIPAIKHAPWAVLASIRALGGERPTILCKKLESTFHRGANYIEVDVDVGSSTIACAITGRVLPVVAGLIIEHAFVLEGKTEDELPERLLAAIRVQEVDLLSNTVEVPVL
jgi:hypothetical protein